MSRKQDYIPDSASPAGAIHAQPPSSSLEDSELVHPTTTPTTATTHPVTTFYPPLPPSPMFNSYAYPYPYQGPYEVAAQSSASAAAASASASAEDPYQLGINMATNPHLGFYSMPGTPAAMSKKSMIGGGHMGMGVGMGTGMGMGIAIQPTKLFIGQIPPTVTEDQLYKVMQQFGQVTEVVLVRRRMADDNTMPSTLSPNFGSPLSVGATRGDPLDSSALGHHHQDDDPGDDEHHHDRELHDDDHDRDDDHDQDDENKQQPEDIPQLSQRSEESLSESAAITDQTHGSSTTSSSSANQQPTDISRIGSELEVAPDADADVDAGERTATGTCADGNGEVEQGGEGESDRTPDQEQELAVQMQQQVTLEDETPPRGPTHSTSSTTVASLPASKLKICGFVKFATPESTVAAIEALHNKYVFPEAEDGAPIRVKYADQRKAFLRKGITKLFVGQLPKDISEEQLAQVFSMHGDIMHCHVLRYGGSSRGCGFVEYQTREQADRAILNMNGVCVFDPRRPLNVRYAESSNDKMVRKRFDSMSDIPSEAAWYDDGAQYSSSSGTNRFGSGSTNRSSYASGSSSYKPPMGAMQQQQQQQRYGSWVDPSVNLSASIGMTGRQAHAGVGFPGSSSKGMGNPSAGLAQQSAAAAASAAAANYYPQMMAYYPQYSNMAPYPVYFTPANPEDYVYYSNTNGVPVQIPGMATNFGADSGGSLAVGISNLSNTPGASPAPYMTSPGAALLNASGYPPYLSLENNMNGMATTAAAASSIPQRYVSQGRTRSFGDHQGSKLG